MSPVVLLEERPTARKQHACSLCARVIEAGETYSKQHNVYDGRAYVFKTCLHCLALVALTDATDWADDEGYTMETIIDWTPDAMWEWRLKAKWRRRWRKLDGTLYPVPVKP